MVKIVVRIRHIFVSGENQVKTQGGVFSTIPILNFYLIAIL